MRVAWRGLDTFIWCAAEFLQGQINYLGSLILRQLLVSFVSICYFFDSSVAPKFSLSVLTGLRLISRRAPMNIELHTRPSSSPGDIISTGLSREIIGAICSNVLSIINSYLLWMCTRPF